jgi:hypothetical protein
MIDLVDVVQDAVSEWREAYDRQVGREGAFDTLFRIVNKFSEAKQREELIGITNQFEMKAESDPNDFNVEKGIEKALNRQLEDLEIEIAEYALMLKRVMIHRFEEELDLALGLRCGFCTDSIKAKIGIDEVCKEIREPYEDSGF